MTAWGETRTRNDMHKVREDINKAIAILLKVLYIRYKSYHLNVIWRNGFAIRQLSVSEMLCENICFEPTAPVSGDHLDFRPLPANFWPIRASLPWLVYRNPSCLSITGAWMQHLLMAEERREGEFFWSVCVSKSGIYSLLWLALGFKKPKTTG